MKVRLTEEELVKLISKIINENEDEINRILDKISAKGINSLTRTDKMVLSNSKNRGYDVKEDLISLIKDKVEQCGMISTGELYSDTDIMYQEDAEGIHLIDTFYNDGVEVTIYGGYKNETVVREYGVSYEELDLDILEQIYDMIEEYECE
jgi:hypothetical protein